MQRRSAPSGPAPTPRAENSKVVRSRDGNQGGEMAVSVTELESLDMPRAGVDPSLIAREPALARVGSPSCFQARYSALNRGAENASRAS